VKPANQSKPAVVAVQPVQNKTNVQAKPVVAAGKPVAITVPAHPAGKTQAPVATPKVVSVAKADSHKPEKQPVVAVKAAPDTKVASTTKAEDKKPEAAPETKSIAQNGRRDPFVSPIMSVTATGSGCSSGKRCLAIDQINLKGVVKSDTGMIAVVVNSAEKAYFLRENDPVFNGYVVKITGDSIVFKETFHDKLGKPLTRDVTKTISRPVA
jgi:Tfp pilus assembly protein PilP